MLGSKLRLWEEAATILSFLSSEYYLDETCKYQFIHIDTSSVSIVEDERQTQPIGLRQEHGLIWKRILLKNGKIHIFEQQMTCALFGHSNKQSSMPYSITNRFFIKFLYYLWCQNHRVLPFSMFKAYVVPPFDIIPTPALLGCQVCVSTDYTTWVTACIEGSHSLTLIPESYYNK